jgi:hypothetical protein
LGVMTLRSGPDQVVPFLDALGVALANHEHDGRGIGRGVAGQLGLPVLGDLAAVLGDGVDVVGQGQRHHVGVEPIDDGTRLLPRSAVGLIDLHLVAGLAFPILGEGRIEVMVQLARRIVGDVEQIDLFGGCGRGHAERGQEGGEGEGFHGHWHPCSGDVCSTRHVSHCKKSVKAIPSSRAQRTTSLSSTAKPKSFLLDTPGIVRQIWTAFFRRLTMRKVVLAQPSSARRLPSGRRWPAARPSILFWAFWPSCSASRWQVLSSCYRPCWCRLRSGSSSTTRISNAMSPRKGASSCPVPWRLAPRPSPPRDRIPTRLDRHRPSRSRRIRSRLLLPSAGWLLRKTRNPFKASATVPLPRPCAKRRCLPGMISVRLR